MLGEGKRWRGVNGARGKGIGERKDGAGSSLLGVVSVANIESRGGLWFGSKKRRGVKSLQMDREGSGGAKLAVVAIEGRESSLPK